MITNAFYKSSGKPGDFFCWTDARRIASILPKFSGNRRALFDEQRHDLRVLFDRQRVAAQILLHPSAAPDVTGNIYI